MRASIWTGVGRPLVVEEVEPLPPGPEDVVVEIDGSGVCHTEAAIMAGHLPFPSPSILGHEVTGVVVETGRDVRRVRVGDRVISAGMPACGACFHCVRAESHLCDAVYTRASAHRARRGDGAGLLTFADLGGFAQRMTVSQDAVVAVESDLPPEQLAVVGCAVLTGVGAALNTAAVTPGSDVVVVGCGGVGQCVVQGARIAGAAQIIAVDPVASKRSAALAQGATAALDPGDGPIDDQVKALTGGRGADYAFEVVGRADAFQSTYGLARRGGVVVMVGMPPVTETISFPAFSLFIDAKEIRASTLGSSQIRRDIPRLVSLAETGRLDLGALVTRCIGLDDLNDAFAAMEAGDVIRSVITRA